MDLVDIDSALDELERLDEESSGKISKFDI